MTVDDIADYMEQDTEIDEDWNYVRRDGSGPEYTRLVNYLTRIGCRPGYNPSMANLRRACEAVRPGAARIAGDLG